jgi:hypothetical protein
MIQESLLFIKTELNLSLEPYSKSIITKIAGSVIKIKSLISNCLYLEVLIVQLIWIRVQ